MLPFHVRWHDYCTQQRESRMIILQLIFEDILIIVAVKCCCQHTAYCQWQKGYGNYNLLNVEKREQQPIKKREKKNKGNSTIWKNYLENFNKSNWMNLRWMYCCAMHSTGSVFPLAFNRIDELHNLHNMFVFVTCIHAQFKLANIHDVLMDGSRILSICWINFPFELEYHNFATDFKLIKTNHQQNKIYTMKDGLL